MLAVKLPTTTLHPQGVRRQAFALRAALAQRRWCWCRLNFGPDAEILLIHISVLRSFADMKHTQI